MMDYKKLICSTCHVNDHIIVDVHSGVVCGNCGLVQIDRILDCGSERATYSEDLERGNNFARSSGFSEDSIGINTTVFVNGSQELIKILNRAQKRTIDRRESKALSNMHHINEICSRLELSKYVKARAIEYYQSCILDEQLIFADKILLAGVVVYFACRVEGYPRIFEEIAIPNGMDLSEFARLSHRVAKKLSLNVRCIKSTDLINRMASKCILNYKSLQYAYHMCENIHKFDVLDHLSPQLIVATVIVWIALMEEIPNLIMSSMNKPLVGIDITFISHICFVSMALIHRTFHEMQPMITNLLPKECKYYSLLLQPSHGFLLTCKLSNLLIDEKYLRLKLSDMIDPSKQTTLTTSTNTTNTTASNVNITITNNKKRKLSESLHQM